jgi:hypothetical protein
MVFQHSRYSFLVSIADGLCRLARYLGPGRPTGFDSNKISLSRWQNLYNPSTLATPIGSCHEADRVESLQIIIIWNQLSARESWME